MTVASTSAAPQRKDAQRNREAILASDVVWTHTEQEHLSAKYGRYLCELRICRHDQAMQWNVEDEIDKVDSEIDINIW